MSTVAGALILLFFIVRMVAQALGRAPLAAVRLPTWQGIVRFVVYAALFLGWVMLLAWVTDGWQEDLQGVVMLGLGLVAPIFALVWGPHWLAWRVLAPRGLVGPAALLLKLALYRHPFDRPGAVALLRELHGGGSTDLDRAPVSAWTACAFAARFERQGDPLRAGAQIAALRRLPGDARVSHGLRVYGIEALAALAAARGDWWEVVRRTGLGRGRGVRLWDGLARARVGQPRSPFRHWLAWALAPARRTMKPLVRETLALQEAGLKPPVARTHPAESPWLRHLRLLDAAARGEPFEIREVLSLAAAWDAPLAPEQQARLHLRGLELEARDAAQAGTALMERILDELDLLLSAARGSWPVPGEGVLETELRRRFRERLFDRLGEREPLFSSHGERPDLAPAQEWEEWVRFRADVDRLEAIGGEEDLHAAWRFGLRRAGNWAVYLHNRFEAKAAWATYVMFLWTVEMARLAGDPDTERVFTENARLAREVSGVVL